MTAVDIATRVYALGLRAFPSAHRAAYGAEMIDAFGRELAAMRERGRSRAVRFAVAAWLNVVSAGLGERRRTRTMRRRMGEAPMRLPVSVLDVKLGLRMLVRFPGLTFAGGLALAIAIGVGAGWYVLVTNMVHPRLPLPDGDRFVEVEMHDSRSSRKEWRMRHDFLAWRHDLRSVEQLGAYRTLERNLIIGDTRQLVLHVAETTASAFTVTQVPPILGRTLNDADEQPNAPAVVVIGHGVWQQRFGGDPHVVGRTVQLGRSTATVIGVMPEGFSFPEDHRLWVPLRLRPSGYLPLEGSGVRVFGRLAAGTTRAQAQAELSALGERAAAVSPGTHQYLRPRVLAYGAEAPDEGRWVELAFTHMPVLLVLLIACVNVGTLTYARTAAREAEIAMRYALGASRGRVVSQLFIEALVLAGCAAAAGLFSAHVVLKAASAYIYDGGKDLPFWVSLGLTVPTVLYAVALAVAGAAILGVLPALKATRSLGQAHLRNLGTGGATLRFGKVWTAVMIGQVAVNVICIPPAMGFAEEAFRDRVIRMRFPADDYLALQVELDRESATMDAEEPAAAFASRFDQVYRELEERVAAEPGVLAVTFGDRLPGMGPEVNSAEIETATGAAPVRVPNLWATAVGPGYFDAFEKPILSGRDFHEGDRAAGARTVLVNEAFARRFMSGASPVGRRVRYGSFDPAADEPWFEIVGMVRDVGMTPTDHGEAPYVYRAASPSTASPLVMGVRAAGDPTKLVPRIRAIAAGLDAGLRLSEVQPLDELVWQRDLANLAVAGAMAGVIGLGLFLSASGIFALMSVSVSRRTREIGLRSALGASPARLLRGIFSRALILIGSGVLVGNFVLILVFGLSHGLGVSNVAFDLAITSVVMLAVGLLACVHPARRALRIDPTDALKAM